LAILLNQHTSADLEPTVGNVAAGRADSAQPALYLPLN
jgi:hypothetical protein